MSGEMNKGVVMQLKTVTEILLKVLGPPHKPNHVAIAVTETPLQTSLPFR